MNLDKNKIVYIDISQFLKNRFQTGIQRVIKEFLLQALKNGLNFNVIYFFNNSYFTLTSSELKNFLWNVKNFKIMSDNQIDIFVKTDKKKIFLEIDSVWNEEENKRIVLYPKLKSLDFEIINFIYDLIPIKYPHLMRENTQKNFLPYIKAITTYSDKVIFDSYSAKSDFLELFKNSYKKDLKLKVSHLGSNFSQNLRKIDCYDFAFINKKYILFVATIEPRKRQDIVLEAFEELQKKFPDLILVFAGSFGWNVDNLKNKIIFHPLRENKFFHFENISDEQLKILYEKAFIVTYLSDYEGFGLPIAESLYYKNITIVSNNSSIKEVGRDFVDYLTENRSNELISLIESYLRNIKKYNSRKEYILYNYKEFSWQDFYNEILVFVNNH